MTRDAKQIREQVQQALAKFAQGSLLEDALHLFAVLGYESDRQMRLSPNTAAGFVKQWGTSAFNAANAMTDKWRSVDVVMQLTDRQINNAGQTSLFAADREVDPGEMQSYLVFAIDLEGDGYSRTRLAQASRAVNRLFPMPVLILFRHGATLTLSIVDRRPNRVHSERDVLEKVTLIKDIRFADPIRAHIDILTDLSLDRISTELYPPHSWNELHAAWAQVLDTSELNKRFFRELANWYYWAQKHLTFPKGAGKNEEERKANGTLRLITRLIFVWFIKEKGLVPEALFNETYVGGLLRDLESRSSTYYKAILQNLFFGTLNTEMGTREFRHRPKTGGARSDDYMSHDRYRYEDFFSQPKRFLELTANIPFLNGGLFECLDKSEDERVDGFSDRPDNPIDVPNVLFFGDKRIVDLNDVFGTKNKTFEVRGLIRLLERYKFTVDENTPVEEEVALDPELLGKVFENLLAAYNPETGVTARKATGSFYTPREIVTYMVDESLIAYFETKLHDLSGQEPDSLDRQIGRAHV